MTTDADTPARAASRLSMAAASDKRRKDWLALFADDAVVQDPVGMSPLDPSGSGHCGLDAIAAFWEASVAHTDSLTFEIRDSFACGDEVANVGSIVTVVGGHRIVSEGVFVYRVDENGKILSLRAFWEFDRAMATATAVTEE